jgi:tetratricopeptide (TPR) repeat protein
MSIEKIIQSNWHPPKGDQTQTVVVQFDIGGNGKVSNIRINEKISTAVDNSKNSDSTTSKSTEAATAKPLDTATSKASPGAVKPPDEAYKQAAIAALKKADLPPLPADAPRSVSLNFTFSYNVLNKFDREDLVVKQWLAKLAQHRSPENHAGLAEAYENDGDFARAREQLLLAIAKERGPQLKRYEEMLRDIELQVAEVKNEIADLSKDAPKPGKPMGMPQAALNNQGATALNNSDYPTAIQKLSQALNIDPGYKLARNNLGMVFNNRGIKERTNKVKALLDFHRAQLLRTDDTASEKNISTSIKAIIRGKDSYQLRKDLADQLAARHDDVGAICEYRRALEIKDDPKIRESLQSITDRVMASNYSDSAFVTDPW